MPNPSEMQRHDEHGPIKSGVVFDRAPDFQTAINLPETTALLARVAELEAMIGERDATIAAYEREYKRD